MTDKGTSREATQFCYLYCQEYSREQHFQEYSYRLQLIQDNNTYWNSQFNILEYVHYLKDTIFQYSKDFPNPKYKDDILTVKEQETLTIIQTFLRKLKIATKAYESSSQCLDVIIPIIDYILTQFEYFRTKYADYEVLGLMFQSSQTKMTKYYQLSDSSPTYVYALVLNP